MVVLVIIVAGLHTVTDYYTTKNQFEKNSRHLKQQTEAGYYYHDQTDG